MTRRAFGTTPDGTRVDEYTLDNGRGLRLHAIAYGAIVTQLHVPDREGRTADVVLGFDSLAPYLAGHPYFGCIVGRVAGRVPRGRFAIDGVEHALTLNEPPNHLHGGHVGFDKRVWTVDDVTPKSIRFSLVSPDGDEGYPGTVRASVTYTLTDADEFRIDYEATADRATPLSLTHHGYFNLAGEGSGRINDHTLQLHASEVMPVDDAMTPLGRRERVTAANDFRAPRRIGDAIPHLFKQHGDLYYIDRDAASVARLTDPASGRAMTIRSAEPCVQLYTASALDGALIGKSGRPYPAHGAVCLECQRYPADCVLRPGETYRQTTVQAFAADSRAI